MRKFARLNWLLFAAMLALVGIGGALIRSAGMARANPALHDLWQAHLAAAACGLVVYFALAAADYRKLLDWTAKPVFVAALALLVAVLVFGGTIFGGRRWLWFFQPSETAKFALVVFLAQFYGRPPAQGLQNEDDLAAERRRFGAKGLLWGLAAIALPTGLILAEPDMGTALVLLPTALAMLLCARVCTRGLVVTLAAALVVAGSVLTTFTLVESRVAQESERAAIYARLPFKAHQVKRLRTFVNPDGDRYGSGWNVQQSKISIGSGSLMGKGLGKGEQKALGYLPPAVAMNDFIFAVLAEELGFAGCAVALALYLAVLWAVLAAGARARDDRGRLLAVGAATLLFSHVFVNVGMGVGLVPITGLPLPFLSKGNTFLVVVMALLGLVQSVAVHGREEEQT